MTQEPLPELIETPRLVLRPFQFEDVDDVLAYASDEEWGKYLIGIPQPYRRSHAVEFLARQARLDRVVHPTWALVLSASVVGGINIRFKFDHLVGEIGWAIARGLWGRGLATEAAQAIVDTAFGTYPQLKRIRATADDRNVASHRVMEKLGMRREGTLRQDRVARGQLVDEAYYGLLRDEWQKRTSKS
jgi:ribosomal-protein-alanine N-acetyltransferase